MLRDHVAQAIIPTPDIDALRPFYEEVLGIPPFEVLPSAVRYRTGEGSIFALSRSGGRASGTHTQLSFVVPDVAAEVAELRARGVVFEEYDNPRTEGGIAMMPAGRAAWFKDPDGNLLGMIELSSAS